MNQQIFTDIERICEKDPGTITEHLGKLTEEMGEVATAVNILNGRKISKTPVTDEYVKENLVEEVVDMMQVGLSILCKQGVPFAKIVEVFHTKNLHYQSFVNKLNGIQK